MRAVNLIPADQRRAAGAAGKSGGGVYVLLGVLALVVACVAALTLTNKQAADKAAEADRVEAQAVAAEAKAGNLAQYKAFNQLVTTRAEGVKTLAATRFDWGATLAEISRVVPADVSLTQLAASTAPGMGVGGTVPARNALQNPAVELIGCAPTQARVALLMARLRRLGGVQRVSISTSSKSDDAAGAGAQSTDSGESGGTGCQIDDEIPQFQIVVFFGAPQAAAASTGSNGVQSTIDAINAGTAGTTTTPAPAAPGS